ncbi:hypothetical protein MKEN_00196000 [Mycena kentingensis (nom. inval.)]|nr:hypothetical protein MKEN_00196000 [Mycena kentingensis (nom. inval.)]
MSLLSLNSTQLPAADNIPSCDNIHSCRTLFDIVWGSLVTIFASTWVSMHPNVPKQREVHQGPLPLKVLPLPLRKAVSGIWRKILETGLDLKPRATLMLIAFLAPEFITGYAAIQLALAWKISREFDLTITQGFFVCMGGFVDGEDCPIITRKQIRFHITAIRDISTRRIRQKSKGDLLSKAVAFFQAVWFVAQARARAMQKLPQSPLEIFALGLCVVNLLTWLLWWLKPMDVSEPIVLDIVGDSESEDDVAPFASSPQSSAKLLWWAAAQLVELAGAEAVEQLSRRKKWFLLIFLGSLVGVSADVFFLIPRFLRPDFPSKAEMWVWEISTEAFHTVLIILCLPFIFQKLSFFKLYARWIFFGTGIIYVLARLCLSAVALSSLRSLRPAVFRAVDWAMYI